MCGSKWLSRPSGISWDSNKELYNTTNCYKLKSTMQYLPLLANTQSLNIHSLLCFERMRPLISHQIIFWDIGVHTRSIEDHIFFLRQIY